MLMTNSKGENRYRHHFKRMGILYSSATRRVTLPIVFAGLIGVAVGGAILLFNWSVEFAGIQFDILFEASQGRHVWSLALIPFIPALGGLIVGMLNEWVFRVKPGHGVPEVILASRFGRGVIKRRAIAQKLLTASVSIGSGGGGGREGPIIHLGASVGVLIAELLRLTREQTRTLIACGAAAGISGIFNSPIGGVMFVLEVVLGDFRLKTFTPIVVASVAATVVTRSVYGDVALVYSPEVLPVALHEYAFLALLGLMFGLLSAYFTKSVIAMDSLLRRVLRLPAILKPAAGGFAAGLLILFLPSLMEQSYAPVNEALSSSYPVWLLVVVAMLKPLHAALTVGSGGTGGMFAPAMKTGAMMGSAFGLTLMSAFPGLVSSPTPYALAGMGALLAGTMHAPLTAVLMVIEISGNYGTVLPSMLTAVLAVLVAQRFVKPSIYSWKIDPSHGRIGSFAYLPLLNTIPIESLIDRDTPGVRPETRLQDVMRIFESSTCEALLVADADGAYKGIIEFEDVRSVITDVPSGHALLAADLMITSVKPVTEDTTLDVVLRLFDVNNLAVIPVVDSETGTRAVGAVSSYRVHTFYRKSVAREE